MTSEPLRQVPPPTQSSPEQDPVDHQPVIIPPVPRLILDPKSGTFWGGSMEYHEFTESAVYSCRRVPNVPVTDWIRQSRSLCLP